jgi:hypothetical protein
MTITEIVNQFMDLVFDDIAHGDEEHRAWLKAKCEELKPILQAMLEVK